MKYRERSLDLLSLNFVLIALRHLRTALFAYYLHNNFDRRYIATLFRFVLDRKATFC